MAENVHNLEFLECLKKRTRGLPEEALFLAFSEANEARKTEPRHLADSVLRAGEIAEHLKASSARLEKELHIPLSRRRKGEMRALSRLLVEHLLIFAENSDISEELGLFPEGFNEGWATTHTA